MSPPVGPTGVVTCTGEDPAEGAPAADPFRAGLALGAFGSELRFVAPGFLGPIAKASIERVALTGTLDWRIGADSTLSFGAGAGLGGRIAVGAQRHEIAPGWLASAAYSYRALAGTGVAPFVLLGASFGASGAGTRDVTPGVEPAGGPSLHALDLRGSVTVGKTFWGVMSPYASARAFGGPVWWELGGRSVTGTDEHHYQVGLGLVTALPGGFDLFVEGMPLGERAIAMGGGASF